MFKKEYVGINEFLDLYKKKSYNLHMFVTLTPDV